MSCGKVPRYILVLAIPSTSIIYRALPSEILVIQSSRNALPFSYFGTTSITTFVPTYLPTSWFLNSSSSVPGMLVLRMYPPCRSFPWPLPTPAQAADALVCFRDSEKKRVCVRKDRSKGRNVAQHAAAIPSPVSTHDHIATSVVAYRKSAFSERV